MKDCKLSRKGAGATGESTQRKLLIEIPTAGSSLKQDHLVSEGVKGYKAKNRVEKLRIKLARESL